MTWRINQDQLHYSTPLYSYEFIARRPVGQQWRIRDSQDNAVGSAATVEAAIMIVERLNATRGTCV